MRDFSFLEKPDVKLLNETLESLKSQGVVNAQNEMMLTPLGMILAKLPVDVSIGKVSQFHLLLLPVVDARKHLNIPRIHPSGINNLK